MIKLTKRVGERSTEIEFETVGQLKEYEAEEVQVSNNLEVQVEKLKADLTPVRQWVIDNREITPVNGFVLNALNKVFELNK